MRLVLRLPYYVHVAEPAVANAPVLLFLHGIGEGFVNKTLEQIGHKNLLQQGPPKYIQTVSPDHPLRKSFTLVAPQLPDRGTLWSGVVDDVEKILVGHRSDKGKLYIFGFSKGGLGAFQVAKKLRANALVTVDASPMEEAPEELIDKWVNPLKDIPFWAIHTNYEPNEPFEKIQKFNRMLTDKVHYDPSAWPSTGAQWRSSEKAPAEKTSVERHVWICDKVSQSTAPYEWLLQH
jgi:predicted peptidase